MVVQAFINLNHQFPSGFRSSAGIVENDGQNKEREKSLGHNSQWEAEEITRNTKIKPGFLSMLFFLVNSESCNTTEFLQ